MKHSSFLIALLMLLLSAICMRAQEQYVELYKLPNQTKPYISETRYDYSQVAEQLTGRCKTNLEKIVAIYDWITRNIAYDTSYSIHTADDCFDAKKGVCQGYCELFYRISEAAGLQVEIVSGISRNIFGTVSNAGHAWIFAYTRENHGILLDPTWDAGAVNGGIFTRDKYHRSWFGVDPKWLILTHFPEDPSYQLIPEQMSEEEFRSLNYPFYLHNTYGFDVNEIFSRARKHTLSLPKAYSGGEGDFVLLEAPLQSDLSVGQSYKIRVKMKTDREFVLVDGRFHSIFSEDWVNEGNGVYSIMITPSSPGEIHLGIRDRDTGGSVSTVIIYHVSS